MGQAELLYILGRSPVPLSAKDLAQILSQSESTINAALAKMRKHGEIQQDWATQGVRSCYVYSEVKQ